MQNEIIDTILNLFSDPLVLILTLWIIGIIVAIAIFRRPKGRTEKQPKGTKQVKIKSKSPLMKKIQKMAKEERK